MKPLSLTLAVTTALGIAALPAEATDYTATLPSIAPPAGDHNWDTVPWSPVGVPGALDNVTDITSGRTLGIYLNGNQTVAGLTKATTTNIRFYNGDKALGDDQTTSNTFTVGTLSILRGSYLFWGKGAGRLTVNAGTVIAGDQDAPASPQPALATLSIGTSTGTNNTHFTSSRLELHHRVNVTIGRSSENISTVDFGEVVYHNTSSSIAQIIIGDTSSSASTDTAFRVRAASLATAVSPSSQNSNLVRGNGVLDLYGNAPGVFVYEGLIQDSTRVEKTGSGIQVFSRGGGNTYGGGTLISGGVLAARNSSNSAFGRGSVEIAAGGTLAGNGQVRVNAGNQITLRSGGRIAPSADLSTSAQILHLDSTGLTSGSTLLEAEDGARFAFQFHADGNDQIAFLNYSVGNFEINPGDEVLVDISGDVSEGVYTLFTFDSGTDGSNLIDSGLSGGLIAGDGFEGYTATFHYDQPLYGGVGSISLQLQAIPEPGHYALMLMAGAIGVFFHRKRATIL